MAIYAEQLKEPEWITLQLPTKAALSAYGGALAALQVPANGTFKHVPGSELPVDNVCVLAATGKGGGRWIRNVDSGINVKWYSAVGDEHTDDTLAIQAAIDFAGSQFTNGANNLRHSVYFPGGRYRITSPLNVCDKSGVWLVGAGGRYISSVIMGNTSGIIVDLSGSTLSGIENLMLDSPNGYPNASTIGIQIALSKDSPNQSTPGAQKAGLNCGIKNCSIFLGSFPNANGGLGSIGILGCRAEEIGISDCMVRANSPAIFTNTSNLANTGNAFTVLSPYASIQDNSIGSMGVIDFSGQCSLQTFEFLRPALLLNGINGLRFHGYLGRIGNTPGRTDNYHTAIRTYQYTNSVQISGTIESYSTLIHTEHELENAIFNVSMANQPAPAEPVIKMSEGSRWKGCKTNIWWGNPGEVLNRAFIYLPPVSDGNAATTSSLQNCEFHIPQFPDNTIVCSAHLLKNAINVQFLTGQPFEKKGMWLRDIKNYPKLLGFCGPGEAVTAGPIIHFNLTNKLDTSGGSGGFYLFKIEGTVMIGGTGSGGNSVAYFRSTLLMSQVHNSGRTSVHSKTVISNMVSLSVPYVQIEEITASLTFPEAGHPYISLSVKKSGTAFNEPVTFHGEVSTLTDFLVNHSALFD